VSIYLSLHYVYHNDTHTTTPGYVNYVSNPYAIGVLVSSVSFLIIFRANYGYQRYWEACTTVHQLMSKWMDATVFAAVFHLQSKHHVNMKPPNFFEYDELNQLNLTRDRERWTFSSTSATTNNATTNFMGMTSGNNSNTNNVGAPTTSPVKSLQHSVSNDNLILASENGHVQHNIGGGGGPLECTTTYTTTTTTSTTNSSNHNNKTNELSPSTSKVMSSMRRRRYRKSINETKRTRIYRGTSDSDYVDETHLLGPPRLDGGWGLLYPDDKIIHGRTTATFCYLNEDCDENDDDDFNENDNQQPPKPRKPLFDEKGFASTRGGRTPSLFLQELTHLSSLLVAVALATLRHDLEDAEPPLGVYHPGQPWPVADPIDLPKEVKAVAYEHRRFARNVRYLLGMDQTKRSRTIYNAARPMLVLGGVSDNEIAFLQRARGPYAKTQLVCSWLNEFMIREHLAGSMGEVGTPIVSRIVQFISDGMTCYNHALKVVLVPFPFPHAQLSAFFVLMMMVAIPLLMDQYTNKVWLGAVLTFLTVVCLAGLHEVARELETPYRSAPNDIPLCTLLAYYNEALITTFAGFHPDAYWDRAEVVKRMKDRASSAAASAIDVENEATAPFVYVDDEPILVSELLRNVSSNGRESTVLPRDDTSKLAKNTNGTLEELRALIDSQANEIRDLQERVQKKKARSTYHPAITKE